MLLTITYNGKKHRNWAIYCIKIPTGHSSSTSASEKHTFFIPKSPTAKLLRHFCLISTLLISPVARSEAETAVCLITSMTVHMLQLHSSAQQSSEFSELP